MKISNYKGMITISSNDIDYANMEGAYIDGDGVGLQCNHEESSKEYKRIMRMCNEIADRVRELETVIKNEAT